MRSSMGRRGHRLPGKVDETGRALKFFEEDGQTGGAGIGRPADLTADALTPFFRRVIDGDRADVKACGFQAQPRPPG